MQKSHKLIRSPSPLTDPIKAGKLAASIDIRIACLEWLAALITSRRYVHVNLHNDSPLSRDA